jgi:DNA (cytosine-5)-methyltransferase 1
MAQSRSASPAKSKPVFVEVFAGCGGLSLGLKRAGWQGLFAIEKDPFAFETLKANFIDDGTRYPYEWPSWLECQPWSVEDLLANHKRQLRALRGTVDLLAGGPPCQGFSSAGRRRASDPRNSLIERYLEVVDLIQPRVVLLENVLGFTLDFKAPPGARKAKAKNFAQLLQERLEVDYHVYTSMLHASRFGVPQGRKRFILIGVRRARGTAPADSPFVVLNKSRDAVLTHHGLTKFCTARGAISDLKIAYNGRKPSPDCPGFEAIGYRAPKNAFQRAMRDGFKGAPSDTRLARHAPDIVKRFAEIIQICRTSKRSTRQLTTEMREHFGITKLATRVLDPTKPAPTITSMPDDLLHYCEPRTLTVRENARLQTFPDWFVFKGKYTTGGDRRRHEVPRFTQVANAVPPLLAEILGAALLGLLPARTSP